MKFLKSRLLLTVLAPLVLSLSCQNLANAETRRYTFRNGGFIDLACTINNNQSKVVTAKGALGNVNSTNLGIQKQDLVLIKRKIPVSRNGSVNFTKKRKVTNLTKVYLIGSITHSNGSLENVIPGLGAFCT